VVEGLARRNHSNRSRVERDAGANSSKDHGPWEIRWGGWNIEPLLTNREGAFFISPREGVEAMDRESDRAEDDMRMFRQDEFVPTIHPPPQKTGVKKARSKGRKRSGRK
jgi:hypothetical protein